VKNWVVWSLAEQGWWSNEFGWTDIREATNFNEEERVQLHLPGPDGQWVENKEHKGEVVVERRL